MERERRRIANINRKESPVRAFPRCNSPMSIDSFPIQNEGPTPLFRAVERAAG
jgi:hypothetical protein